MANNSFVAEVTFNNFFSCFSHYSRLLQRASCASFSVLENVKRFSDTTIFFRRILITFSYIELFLQQPHLPGSDDPKLHTSQLHPIKIYLPVYYLDNPYSKKVLFHFYNGRGRCIGIALNSSVRHTRRNICSR